MAAVQFTTILCELYTAHNVRTFLYIFMSVVRVLVHKELWVNVPVATFFPTVVNVL